MARQFPPVSISPTTASVAFQQPDLAEWDHFVETAPGGHHAQTSAWAKVKSTIGWQSHRVAVLRDGLIVAGAQIECHSVPLLGKMAYIIKGPINTVFDDGLDAQLVDYILQMTRQRHCWLLVIQPPDNAPHMAEILQSRGFQPSKLRPEPPATLVLDLSVGMNQLEKNLKRQTRQNIRRAERGHIQIRGGGETDLAAFYRLHQATSLRQSFSPYPWEYLDMLWKTYKPIKRLHLLMAELDGTPVSGLLLVCFRDRVLSYILGWSGEFKDLRPNEALFWGAIQWAYAQGYRFFDFEGINLDGARAVLAGQELPPALRRSPDFLKYGFGGKIAINPMAFEYISNPGLKKIYQKVGLEFGGHSIRSNFFSILRKVLMRI